jgi:hypothetical protein
VVAVLKAINLIVTSADENNRSFFLLGFDQDYIIHSVEQHFRSLAPEGYAQDRQFGQEYLKKMVTLSVSVPKPTSEKIRDLLYEIDSTAKGESPAAPLTPPPLKDRIATQLQEIPSWGWRFAAAVTCAAILAIAIAGTLTPHTARRSDAVSGVAQAPILSAGPTPISVPAIVETAGRPKWWLWGIPSVMAILLAGFLFRSMRPSPLERLYRREPRDSEEFKHAVDRCLDLLPRNPRDLVRTINLMRMEYLLQTSPQAPFSGTPLSEWVCVIHIAAAAPSLDVRVDEPRRQGDSRFEGGKTARRMHRFLLQNFVRWTRRQ